MNVIMASIIDQKYKHSNKDESIRNINASENNQELNELKEINSYLITEVKSVKETNKGLSEDLLKLEFIRKQINGKI